MNYNDNTILSRSASFMIAALTMGIALLHTTDSYAASSCPANPTSCDQLADCPRNETWRIDFTALDRLRTQGCEMPLEWRPKSGMGVNTGGTGGVTMTARSSPDDVPMSAGGLFGLGQFGGLGGINLLGGFGSGGGGASCPGTYPPPLDPDHMEGEELPINAGSIAPTCGASVPFTSEYVTLNANPNAATFVEAGSFDMKIYKKTGAANLQYTGKADIPEFYCELKTISSGEDSYIIAEKIYNVSTLTQYHAVSNTNQKIALPARDINGKFLIGDNTLIEDEDLNFIVMVRNGSMSFRPPTPNPEWFTSRGARDVDPKCYTLDRLITPLPHDFGDIRFKNEELGYASVDHLFPVKCVGHTHYVNLERMQMIFKEGQTINLGSISGSPTFTDRTAISVDGTFATNATSGFMEYSGSSVMLRPGNKVHIGLGHIRENNQAFTGGGRLILSNGNLVRVNRPGRIKALTDGRVQFIDGAVVESIDGVILSNLAPMSYASFLKSGARVPIIGELDSAFKPPSKSIMPANSSDKVRLPFDTRSSVACHTGVTPH